MNHISVVHIYNSPSRTTPTPTIPQLGYNVLSRIMMVEQINYAYLPPFYLFLLNMIYCDKVEDYGTSSTPLDLSAFPRCVYPNFTPTLFSLRRNPLLARLSLQNYP